MRLENNKMGGPAVVDGEVRGDIAAAEPPGSGRDSASRRGPRPPRCRPGSRRIRARIGEAGGARRRVRARGQADGHAVAGQHGAMGIVRRINEVEPRPRPRSRSSARPETAQTSSRSSAVRPSLHLSGDAETGEPRRKEGTMDDSNGAGWMAQNSRCSLAGAVFDDVDLVKRASPTRSVGRQHREHQHQGPQEFGYDVVAWTRSSSNAIAAGDQDDMLIALLIILRRGDPRLRLRARPRGNRAARRRRAPSPRPGRGRQLSRCAGIGSFAPTTAWFTFRRMVPDRLIPPTLWGWPRRRCRKHL